MAARIGIPERVLDRARTLAGPDDVRLDNLLETMEEDARHLASERRLLEQERALAQQERTRAEAERRAATEEVRTIKTKALAEARDVLTSLRQKLRELSRSASLDRAEIKRAGQEVETLSSMLSAGTEPARKTGARRDFRAGETVRIDRLNKTGTVVASHGDVLELEVGAKKIRLPAEDVVPAEQSGRAGTQAARGWGAELHEEEGGVDRLNLLGLRVPEALAEVDRFIDRAGVHHLYFLTIIHGLGTGALKTAVTEFLKNHPLVQTMRPGEPAEGGAGVTIVQLKR
jgi:DNA mismatch repair protein MutS2